MESTARFRERPLNRRSAEEPGRDQTLLSSEWVLWIFMDRFRCFPFFTGKVFVLKIIRVKKEIIRF